MARTRTLAELRTEVEQRADIATTAASGTRFTQSEIARYLNQSIRRFVGMLIASHPERYFEKTDDISVVSGTRTYALPTDFFQSTMLRVTVDGVRVDLRRTQSHLMDISTSTIGWALGVTPTYRISGSNVAFDPTPQASHSVRHYYVPTLVVFNTGGTAIEDLSADTDYMDGYNGWEEWVVNDAAMKCRVKNDEPITELFTVNRQIQAEITAAAKDRGGNHSPRIKSTYDDRRRVFR